MVDELLFKTAHGLIDQSLRSRMGVDTTRAVRYSTEHRSRTLFVSQHADALRKLHPDNPRLQQFTDEDRIVVSEPPGDLPGAWLEIPESTALIVQPGPDEQRAFQPHGT